MELDQGWTSFFSMNTSHGFVTRLEMILPYFQTKPKTQSI